MKRNLITKLCVVALATFLSTSAFAQNGRFSIGLELAIPGGDYGDNAGMGFGGSLRYEHPVGDNLGLTLTAGYLTFGSEEITSGFPGVYELTTKYTNSQIPILAGAKYYFMDNQDGFYAGVQVGVTMLSTKVENTVDVLGTKTSTDDTNTATAFTWGVGIGYHLANFDIGAGYYGFSYSQDVTVTEPITGTSITTTADYSGSQIGVRLAYVFGEK